MQAVLTTPSKAVRPLTTPPREVRTVRKRAIHFSTRWPLASAHPCSQNIFGSKFGAGGDEAMRLLRRNMMEAILLTGSRER